MHIILAKMCKQSLHKQNKERKIYHHINEHSVSINAVSDTFRSKTISVISINDLRTDCRSAESILSIITINSGNCLLNVIVQLVCQQDDLNKTR